MGKVSLPQALCGHCLGACCLLFGLTALPCGAQQTISYTNGEASGTAIVTTAPNDPTTLSIATGSATQAGMIS